MFISPLLMITITYYHIQCQDFRMDFDVCLRAKNSEFQILANLNSDRNIDTQINVLEKDFKIHN